MGIIATSVEEQIEKLKGRGLLFNGVSGDKAKEILLDVGYYKLGYYWYHFQKNKIDNFNKGTEFLDIVALYYFDLDLKNLLSRAIYRVESNLKTKIIYYVSNYYRDDPSWFTNTQIVEKRFVDFFNDTIYTKKFIAENYALKKHHRKYRNHKYAPAWKVIDFLSFGQIISLYSNIKKSDLKTKIALCYGVKKIKIFENYLKTIKFIRNISAHNGVLYDSEVPKGIIKTPMINFTSRDRNNLDASIKIILLFLGFVSKNRKDDVEKKINQLFEKHKSNPRIYKILTDETGFVF